ncbi:hypothetical protein JO972_12260 [Verrucomicrobiaceae bacterium 5K15]|uniref:Uncharacterized protein n=1 Tax=Oceaniferula flava TaxID=2800421 RepID=A0AAE2SEX4_9BACT|nr:hypothetical protein [Oceaniferula flavus]MBK1855737.1 hypothetical protein [Oceaniferula flavus]MBM1137044.1 hypothetical protein [Oceaniferula flavus]
MQAEEQGSIRLRIDAEGFQTRPADLSKLLHSTTQVMGRHLDRVDFEKMVVVRGRRGPAAMYRRNDQGEIVILLDSQGRQWSQYSYQWAHEFCHVLCGLRDDGTENDWFEETICELASLYCLRAMADDWKTQPPYPHWKIYATHLQNYAEQVMAQYPEIEQRNLAAYYRKHRFELRRNPKLRQHNGAMAVALLPLFERQPKHWDALRYLNVTAAKPGLSFRAYLSKWIKDAPPKHHALIERITTLYGEM